MYYVKTAIGKDYSLISLAMPGKFIEQKLNRAHLAAFTLTDNLIDYFFNSYRFIAEFPYLNPAG